MKKYNMKNKKLKEIITIFILILISYLFIKLVLLIGQPIVFIFVIIPILFSIMIKAME